MLFFLGFLAAQANGATPTQFFLQSQSQNNQMQFISYFSQGDGYFTPYNSLFNHTSSEVGVIPCDFNGDNNTDVVQFWENNKNVSIAAYLSAGNGSWTFTDTAYVEGTSYLTLFCLDIDGDGKQDILQTWNDNKKMGFVAYMSQGNGSFTTVGTATGYCFFLLSYQTLNQELLLSGCCSGLAGSLYSVYAYQAYDDYTSSIYYENALYIKNDQPFSFKIPVDPFKIAILITGKTKYVVALSGSSDTFEYVISSDAFPKFTVAPTCQPYIPAAKNPASGYKCYYTSSQPDPTINTPITCGSTTEYCGVQNYGTADTPNEDWDCFPLDVCYSCSCGATLANLPSSAAVCCEGDGCNVGDFSSFLPALCTTSAGSNIAVGFFLSLFVALFINWFN
jgi:hypothetical protein